MNFHLEPSRLLSTVFIHQPRPVDAAVGDAAGTDQDAVAGAAGEVAAAADGAVVLSLGTSQLQAEPKAQGEVGRAQVADESHLVGAA